MRENTAELPTCALQKHQHVQVCHNTFPQFYTQPFQYSTQFFTSPDDKHSKTPKSHDPKLNGAKAPPTTTLLSPTLSHWAWAVTVPVVFVGTKKQQECKYDYLRRRVDTYPCQRIVFSLANGVMNECNGGVFCNISLDSRFAIFCEGKNLCA